MRNTTRAGNAVQVERENDTHLLSFTPYGRFPYLALRGGTEP